MQRRPLVYADLDALIRDLQQLRAAGYTRLGNWTLSQMCDHLAVFFLGSLDGFSRQLPWLIRVLVGKPMLKAILRRGGFRPGIRVPKEFLPGTARQDEPAVDSLVALVWLFQASQGPLHPSPIFGQLSKETWTKLHLIHAAHHLSFLVPAGPA